MRGMVCRPSQQRRAACPRALAPGTLSLLAAIIPLTGCDHRASPPPHDSAGRQAVFAAAYSRNCSGCHGPDGRLGPAPPLNDALFLAWIPEEAFAQTVRDGRPGALMPAFIESRGGSLTESEIDALVRGAMEQWGKPREGVGSLPPYGLSTATRPDRERVERGERLFATVCARCHGADGRGDIAGALHDQAFLLLISDQVIHRIVVTGRPDLGMPNYSQLGLRGGPGRPLASDEIDALVAFVTSWRVAQPVLQP